MIKPNKYLMKFLVLTLFCAFTFNLLAISAFASGSPQSGGQSSSVEEDTFVERDQVDPNGGTFAQFESIFAIRGLTPRNVNSLQNMGFSYAQILSMSQAQYRNLLPDTFGIRQVRAAPSGFVRVTAVGGTAIEYFHPNTGMNYGHYYDNNDGDWIDSTVYNFTRSVYKDSNPLDVSDLYYLWGEWDDGAFTHQGHDFNHRTSNPLIYSAHSGVVVNVGPTGRVSIYNASEDVTYCYAHMVDIKVIMDQRISVGQVLGREGNVNVTTPHLHFEVNNGRATHMSVPNKNLSSLNPYLYM